MLTRCKCDFADAFWGTNEECSLRNWMHLFTNLQDASSDHSINNANSMKQQLTSGKSSDDETTMSSSKLNLILMVILGDAVHNFIDGLSLGAGLVDSHLTGCSIATAILFEEIPHELGDFWILLSSGMSMSNAIKLNLLSSASCYFGLICGMIIGENWGGNSAIFALTAGMFLYIGLFNLLSDLKNNITIVQSITNDSPSAVLHILFWQNVGIITGVAFLYQLACIDEKFLFQSLTISL